MRFDLPIELVALRVIATGATPQVEDAPPAEGTVDVEQATIETLPAYFQDRWIDTPHVDREKLAVVRASRDRPSSDNTTPRRCCCPITLPKSTNSAT